MYKMMHKNYINYLQCRDNIYYFVRRVPKDIHKHYSSQRISLSLKTKSKRVAEHKCSSDYSYNEDVEFLQSNPYCLKPSVKFY